MNKNTTVILTDSKDKVVAEYMIKRLSVLANTKRMEMNAKILELDISDALRGQLFTCAALAVTLHNKKGELLFPDEDGSTLIDTVGDLDIEVYDALTKAYVEVNPLEPTLTAKKKKS